MSQNDDKQKQAEYNNLQRTKTAKQTEYNNAVAFNNQIDEKIRRLKSAYSRMGLKKENYRNIKKQEKKTIDDDYRWKGNNYTIVISQNGGNLKSSDEKYYREIDSIQDEINNEITRLRNMKYSDTFLGNLMRQINNLGTRIRNFFN